MRFSDKKKLGQFVSMSNDLKIRKPFLIEIICPDNEEIIPKSQTLKKEDGTLISAPLSNMFPPLSDDVRKKLELLDIYI